jgi:hypothetical protein
VPAAVAAVRIGEVARPFASVVTLAVADGGVVAKVPLAPDAGAVNVTVAPLTGFEPLSTTVATSGAANAAPTTALCPDPLVGVIDAAAPAVLVRLKLAVVDTPETDAVTV